MSVADLRSWIVDNSEPEPNTGCYLWKRTVNSVGRPVVSVGGVWKIATRVLMKAPAGSVVRHTCDNAMCVSPDHLVVGTQLENIQDCIARGRKKNPPHWTRDHHPNTKVKSDMIPDIIARRNDGVSIDVIAEEVGCSGAIVRRAIKSYEAM